MYYLDLFSLYKRTNKIDRIKIRKSLKRDNEMAYKLKLQYGKCFYCGCNIDMSSHLDHVVPIYHGGKNKSSNLVASCKRCNLTKGTQQIEITNKYTIKDYLSLINAYNKWFSKVKKAKSDGDDRKVYFLKAYKPKKVQLYEVYRADLFKHI